MHILMMIFGALSAVGFLIWRIQAAATAAREIGDLAKEAANLPRKLAFRRRSGKKGADLVTDPREAAVVLMLEIARARGEVTREQKDTIEAIIVQQFQFEPDEAEEILTQAGWVSAPDAGTDRLMRRMVKVVQAGVSHEDIVELDDMLIHVSEADGAPSREQLAVLQTFRRMTGVLS